MSAVNHAPGCNCESSNRHSVLSTTIGWISPFVAPSDACQVDETPLITVGEFCRLPASVLFPRGGLLVLVWVVLPVRLPHEKQRRPASCVTR
jgi:hypothetical protein